MLAHIHTGTRIQISVFSPDTQAPTYNYQPVVRNLAAGLTAWDHFRADFEQSFGRRFKIGPG